MAQIEADLVKPDDRSSLRIPLWFLVIALGLFALRIYAKITDNVQPGSQAIAWIGLDEFKKKSSLPGGKELVLYEFSADWCQPCKKRERTTFRSPAIIKEINDTFVPVRVDLTTPSQRDNAEVKKLLTDFGVSSIPRCVITLKSGEIVKTDRYLFGDDFADFLKKAVKEASNVRAQQALASGNYEAAIKLLDPDLVQGNESVAQYDCSNYLMCHHLLLMLHRQAEVEPMMERAYKKTFENFGDKEKSAGKHWLDDLNAYLRGRTSDQDLLDKSQETKNMAYLAIGLRHLRQGERAQAIKAFNQAAIAQAKYWNSDKLAEFMVAELEKEKQ